MMKIEKIGGETDLITLCECSSASVFGFVSVGMWIPETYTEFMACLHFICHMLSTSFSSCKIP